VNVRAASDENAFGVEQIDAARGEKLPEDRARRVAGHAVQREPAAVVKRHQSALANREIVPVDDTAEGGLIDGQRVACGDDCAGTGGERASARQRRSGLHHRLEREQSGEDGDSEGHIGDLNRLIG
jgi:hypothetical protein